MRVSPLPGGR